MAIQHAVIEDPDIHEPKGVATATVGQVYVADGAGSGDWAALATHQYADMYIAEGATAFALAAASAYTKLNPTAEWTAGGNEVATITAANGEITLVSAGTYAVSFWISFTTASLASNVQYKFKYALDGTPGSRVLTVQKNTANVDVLSVSAIGVVTATAGQVARLQIASGGLILFTGCEL
jgi:nucleoside phosphorylase